MDLSAKQFLQYLLQQNILNSEQVEACFKESTQNVIPLTTLLVQKKLCTTEALEHYLYKFNEIYNKTSSSVLKEEKTQKCGGNPERSQLTEQATESFAFPSLKKRYIFLETLGEGGMGIIQKARDTLLGREVALKKIQGRKNLSKGLSQKEKMYLWRLNREAEITAILEHPNIVPLYDLQYNEEGEMYFTMRKVQGETLSSLFRKKYEKKSTENQEEFLSIFFKICDAVSYAHSKNIVHRDLKPDNVMVGAFGEVYVMDWGIAKKMKEECFPPFSSPPVDPSEPSAFFQKTQGKTTVETHTQEVNLFEETTAEAFERFIEKELLNPEKSDALYSTIGGLGTPGYMPPEQQQNASQVTPLSDIYALGVILRQCFTLVSPFQEIKIHNEILEKRRKSSKTRKLDWTLDPFKALIPVDLRAIIQKATEIDPLKRYPSVKTLMQDIESYQKNIRVSAREYTPLELLLKWMRRNYKGLVLLSAFILLLSVFGVFFYLQKQKEIQERFSTALKKAREMEDSARIPSQDLGIQIQFLLKAFHYLDTALSIRVGVLEVDQQQAVLGEELIRLACKSHDYKLADYVASEMQQLLSLTESQKKGLLDFIKKEETRLLMQHYERVFALKMELRKRPTMKNREFFVQEISQMKEKEIFQKLLEEFQESISYFLEKEPKETGLNFYYFTLLETFKALKNNEVLPSLIQGLEQMVKALSTRLAEQEEYQINYMIQIIQVLNELKAPKRSLWLHQLREQMGKNSRFFQDSEEGYRRLMFYDEIDPLAQSAEELWRRGNIKLALNDPKGALEDWERAIQKEKHFLNAYVSLAQYYEKEEPSKAFEWYHKALEVDPKNFNVYFSRAQLKARLEDYDSAITDFHKAIEIEPLNGHVHRELGQTFRGVGNSVAAIASFTKTIEINPRRAYPRVLRGMVKYESGDKEGALADYNHAILIDSNHRHAFTNRGVLHLVLKKYEEALFDFNQAVELGESHSHTFFHRGEVYLKMEQYSKSILDYEQAIQLDPTFKNAYAQLIYCYQKLNKPYQALNTLERFYLQEKIPEVLEAFLNALSEHIRLSFRKGEYQHLKEECLRFKKYALPDHPKQEMISAVLEKLEEKEK